MQKNMVIDNYLLDRFHFLLDYYGNVAINIHLLESILFKYWKCYQKEDYLMYVCIM
jgi:hypothetical protein